MEASANGANTITMVDAALAYRVREGSQSRSSNVNRLQISEVHAKITKVLTLAAACPICLGMFGI